MQHMVNFDSNGQVHGFQIRPSRTPLEYTWIIAVWNPRFTCFMHEYVSSLSRTFNKSAAINKDSMDEEISMTQIFEAALQKGLVIDSVSFKEGFFLDIGSPENLKRAGQTFPELADFEENKS
jgi:glucose-1-phosphate thymidylyltransferase